MAATQAIIKQGIAHETIPSLYNAIKAILGMPYCDNGKDRNHEKKIAEKLKQHGFIKYPWSNSIRENEYGKCDDVMGWLEDPEPAKNIPNNIFIEQPCGANQTPDFIIKYNNKCVFLEAKSSKDAKPMYNSGIPNPNILYVFCSKKYDSTTIYRGNDIMNNETRARFDALIKRHRELDEKFNEQEPTDDPENRGWGFYTRPMLQQKAASGHTDYFTHPQRDNVENAALDWIEEISRK